MPQYRLTYFNAKGLGETSRQLFELAGAEYENNIIEWGGEEWPKLKPTTQFGVLPILEVDGKKLGQSGAISRYLARKFGFAGKDEWEQAQVDALGDQYKDFQVEVKPFIFAFNGFAPGDPATLKTEVFDPAVKKNYKFFNDVVKKSGHGFLVGDSVTSIDLTLAENLDLYQTRALVNLDDYPELKVLLAKVQSISAIANWIKIRPEDTDKIPKNKYE